MKYSVVNVQENRIVRLELTHIEILMSMTCLQCTVIEVIKNQE